MSELEITDIRIAQPPDICEVCGHGLRDWIISVDDETTVILFYCPHNYTLVHCSMETVEGQRSVLKWIFEGPVSEDQYISTAKQMGEIHGASMTVHHNKPLQ